MASYKVEICGVNTANLKVLSNEEMKELFIRYKNGDKEAKELLINGNLKLVLSILKKFNNNKYDMNDLFQIGCIGLIKAVDNFDLSFNCLFSTYAVPLITGEIKRYIRDNTTLRVARSIKDNAYHIISFKEDYMKKNGKEPTNEEICQALNLKEYEIANCLDSLCEPASIFDPIYSFNGDTIYLCDTIADKKELNNDKDSLISLKKGLMKIKERE
jgi:RNA polymerase sporulation-specific sigma factor